MDLYQAALDVRRAICNGYDVIREWPARRGNDLEEKRRVLLGMWCDLEEVCYEHYLSASDNIRIPPQESWVPLLYDLFEFIKHFDDLDVLTALIDKWVLCLMAYRGWLLDDPVCQGVLCAMWDVVSVTMMIIDL